MDHQLDPPPETFTKLHTVITANNWCQNAWCLDKNGEKSLLRDDHTCRRCLVAWITFCYGKKQAMITVIYNKVFNKLKEWVGDKGYMCLSDWNDDPTTKFEDILVLAKEVDV